MFYKIYRHHFGNKRNVENSAAQLIETCFNEAKENGQLSGRDSCSTLLKHVSKHKALYRDWHDACHKLRQEKPNLFYCETELPSGGREEGLQPRPISMSIGDAKVHNQGVYMDVAQKVFTPDKMWLFQILYEVYEVKGIDVLSDRL